MLSACLVAAIRHLFTRRDYINRINVFPVPDADTGTNMAFTFRSILEVLEGRPYTQVGDLVASVSEAALDGARGNSGAIMAQFFQGCREAVTGRAELDTGEFAKACRQGAVQAWTAMAEPVEGTLPSVLEGFAGAVTRCVEEGCSDFRELLREGLGAARRSLDRTPEQLPVLKQAGVVDAGGQGFVDLLDGVHAWAFEGRMDPLENGLREADEVVGLDASELDPGRHRFCTECVVEGHGIERRQVMERLLQLDHSSLVVAGSHERVRVHIHVNQPGEAFLACAEFGEITHQKADDMRWQHGLLNQPGHVAVVTDSGADLPASEAERLGIHMVPVRLSFGEREYLDRVTITPADFYRLLRESEVFPQTSQPPARDFRRVYELLAAHGYEVLSVGLSSSLSGTTQAARTAAARVEQGRVEVFDTLNASCGQGLLALVAAEAAADDRSLDEILALLHALVPQTATIGMPEELTSAVRGGRVPAWAGRVARVLRITPIIMAKAGRLGPVGLGFGRGFDARALARCVLKRMQRDTTYRVMIAHAANRDGAREVRRIILERHPTIHSCHLTDASRPT